MKPKAAGVLESVRNEKWGENREIEKNWDQRKGREKERVILIEAKW